MLYFVWMSYVFDTNLHELIGCRVSGWVEDIESTIAARLSQRVKDITWLENDIRGSEGPSSSEPFQVE